MKSMELKLKIMDTNMALDAKQPRNKASRSSKISKSRSRNPKILDKKKKRKKKYIEVSSNSVYGEQNSSKRSPIVDNVQPEPKSILNPSKRGKVITFDDRRKNYVREIFSAGRFSSNNDQTYQNSVHHIPLGLNNVNNVRQKLI